MYFVVQTVPAVVIRNMFRLASKITRTPLYLEKEEENAGNSTWKKGKSIGIKSGDLRSTLSL